jgi:hypothetical protein
MSFTLIGSSSIPSDNGSQAGPSVSSVTGWSGLGSGGQDGDLIVVLAQYKGSGTLSINDNVGVGGGSITYNSLTQVSNGTSNTGRIFWAQIPASVGGVFATSNTFTVSISSGTNAISVYYFIFRPTSPTNVIDIDVSQVASSYAATSPVTIAGITTNAASTLSLAVWMSDDDNTWGTLTGTGWSKTSIAAQIRNLQGQDMSMTAAYQIKSVAGATNDVTQTQTANGPDLGQKFILAWKEVVISSIPNKIYSINQSVNRASTY